ncbi:hypothetical protein [Nitrosomonas sp.]|uniref:hypothetical protein n=1 Tax=Nitrosomonas sp. TaxID=42353 RepID=UPI00271D8230|nr:hypothetical protein [Nitrosomonas sp.]MDO8894207.1 hypothetical protein [Nitrosomonas sp.]
MGQKQTADPNGFTATNPLDRQIHMPGFRVNGGEFVKNRIAAQPPMLTNAQATLTFCTLKC